MSKNVLIRPPYFLGDNLARLEEMEKALDKRKSQKRKKVQRVHRPRRPSCFE